MALVLADRVLETTSVAGTGDAALGGAQTGFQPFSVIGNGSTTYYTIVGVDANHQPTGEWEVGVGTYVSAGNYISRDTVLSSSNGGAKVYFASGIKDIFLDLPSEEVLLSAGDVTGPASAVANNFAAFNMTTGKLIKDSGYNASSFATAAQGTLADTAIQPGDLGTAAYLDAGSALGVATLDAGGKVPVSQIPQMGDLNYQGTWNASTNTPTLTSSAGTKGFYYVVSVAGSTNLNGITDWKVGDWAVFNGSVWEKIDNTDAVTSVNGYTGTVVLTATDVGAAPATSGTSILYGNGSGGTSNVTVGSGLTFVAGTLAATGGGGTGDVVGPSSATDNAVARFDTTTGKLIQNSVVTIDDSGNISGANSISTIDYAQLDTTAAASIAVGKLRWNVDTATAAFGIIDGTTEVNIGQQMYAYVTNAESVTITAGQAVYLYQATGNRASVKLAYNTGDATSAKTLGLVTQDIGAGQTGFVTTQGVLGKLNTGAYSEGDTLYLGATAGSLTATKPKAPNHLVYIGIVERANNGNGQIYVRVQNGFELDEIHDVQINSPANGQTLLYDASTSLWKNANLTAGTGISISNGAASATITNSAPDQTVAITGAGGAVVTGTYPNFTITTPSGTVTSVTGTAPINSTGGATPAISLAASYGDTQNPYASKTANFVLAAPNGTAGVPTFRAVVAADIPTLNQNTTGTAANVTGTVAIANGGTGQTTRQNAMDALAGAVTSGQYLRGNGTDVIMSTIQAADVPTLNQNTTGTAANVTGTVAVLNGGTGSTTASGARTNLGATTVGSNFFTLTNPSAITFPRMNADNTVSSLDAATFRTAIGAGTGSGTVTSVAGTGSYGGLTLSGTVTTSGNITLGGTPTGTWPISITGASTSCSGNAATATSATTATGLNSSNYISRTGSSGNLNTDFQNTPAGTTRIQGDDANLTNSPGNTWWFYQNMRHSNSSNFWGTQIAWGWEDNANRLATRNITGGSFGGWIEYLNTSGRTFTGSLTMSAGISAFSDERLKENWRPVTNNFVAKLAKVKSGVYDRTDVELTQAGVSAQSIQKLLPEVVIEDNDGFLSVAYGNAAMTSAVELAKEVVALKELVKELKAEVDLLKGK